jgi:hypothetical protein
MNRLLSGCVGCMAATISGLTGLAPNTPAGAGVLPLATAMLSSAVPAGVIAVQWGDAWWPRQPWDYAWGAPPYSFPQGRQAHVTYYAAAPYYYQWFQTTNGYNGHFGYPAAAQYADPPPVSRHDYPRPARRLEAFD